MSGDKVVILATCIDILETFGLSLLTFISFGCSILVLLSDKLADEIEFFLVVLLCLLFQFFEKSLIHTSAFIQFHTFV